LILAGFSLVQAARSAGKVQQASAAFEGIDDEQDAPKCKSIMSKYLCKEGSNPHEKDKICIVKWCNDGNDKCCSIADKHKIPREADGFSDNVEVEKPEIIADQKTIAGEEVDAKVEEQIQNGGPEVTEDHDEEGFGHDDVTAVSDSRPVDDELTAWGHKLVEEAEDGAPAEVITDAFKSVDADGDGQIGAEEAASAGITGDNFQEMDQDGDGSIDAAEFAEAVQEGLDQELAELKPEAVESDEGFEAPEVEVTETEAADEEGDVETAFGQAVDEAEADGTADAIVQDELQTEQELQDEEDMADEVAAEETSEEDSEDESSEDESPEDSEDESSEDESPEDDDAEEE